MVRSFVIFVSCFSLLALTGCSGSGYNPFGSSDRRSVPKDSQLVASPDKVSALLADAAIRASTAMETLAAVEMSRSPGVAAPPIGNAPPELLRRVDLSWVGAVGPVTKSMADRAGYHYKIVGTPPVTPIVVSVDVQHSTVIDVLRSIGLQLGQRADVRIDSVRQVVELHYDDVEVPQPMDQTMSPKPGEL